MKPWTPYPYQVRSLEWTLERTDAGLFLQPGLGKTSVELASIVALGKRVRRTLVIAPLHVCSNVWPNEVAKWSDFKNLEVSVLHGSKKSRALRTGNIHVINPEGLPWLLAQNNLPVYDKLIIDESTKFKHGNTQRHKLLRPQLERFKYRDILTGLPTPNGLLDLWGQIYLLDLGERLGRYITHFRNKWFYPSGFGGYKWVPLPGSAKAIRDAISDICLTIDVSEAVGLPEDFVVNDVPIELTGRVRDKYNELSRFFLLQLKTGEVVARNAGAKASKLRQFANGAVYLEEQKGTWEAVHDKKLQALDAILAEREGQPTLVAYEFKHDAARIKAEWPHAVVLGDLSPAKAKLAIEDWNAGKIEILVIHPASAGHGLNLQAGGNAIVWYGLTYNLEHYGQTIARLHRTGQKKRVVVHRLVVTDTVDEAIVAALRRKDGSQSSFLEALKQHYGV